MQSNKNQEKHCRGKLYVFCIHENGCKTETNSCVCIHKIGWSGKNGQDVTLAGSFLKKLIFWPFFVGHEIIALVQIGGDFSAKDWKNSTLVCRVFGIVDSNSTWQKKINVISSGNICDCVSSLHLISLSVLGDVES